MINDDSETRNNGTTTDGRNSDGTFASGNPGRPRGSRHKTTQAIEAMLEGQQEALTQRAALMPVKKRQQT